MTLEGQAAAGWYSVSPGALRYWDGHQWTQHEVVAPSASAGRLPAVLAHLGMVIFAVAVPAIVLATVGRNDQKVRHHATEALNFQASFLCLWLVAIAALLAGYATGGSPGFLLPTMVGAVALAALVSVTAVIQASRGRRWRYYVAIPFIRYREDAGV